MRFIVVEYEHIDRLVRSNIATFENINTFFYFIYLFTSLRTRLKRKREGLICNLSRIG